MSDSSARSTSYRSHVHNTRQSLLCMSGLLLALFLLVGVMIVLLALQQNEAAREQSRFYVEKAVQARAHDVATTLGDYAFWGEAYSNMQSDRRVSWGYQRNNLGSSLYEVYSYEAVFVVQPDRQTHYAVIRGELADVDAEQWLQMDLGDLLQAARGRANDEEPVVGYLNMQGTPALIAAAAFTTGGDPHIPLLNELPAVLLFVDLMGMEELLSVGNAYGITNLRLAAGAPLPMDYTLPGLESASGPSLTLRWDPDRPGTRMLTWVLPLLGLALAVFAYITRFNLRASMAAARRLDRTANEAQRYQGELAFSASHDGLTGLANRTLLKRRLEEACADSRQFGGHLAVMLIDLDGFKPINDNFSHALGDRVLIEVARRMSAVVRPGDTVARMGGDEFIIVLTNLQSEQDVAQVAERVLADVAHPYQFDTIDLRVTASIGIAMSDGQVDEPTQLIQRADSAMYRAKQEGRNNFFWYTDGLDQQVTAMSSLRSDLQHAIDTQALELYYQPQIDGASGKMLGMEALLRWHHPERGTVPPSVFIPVAEATGQIIPLSNWVIDTACRQLRQLNDSSSLRPWVAINVSPTHLLRSNFVDITRAALATHGLEPHQLELEVTESVLLNHADRALDSLRQLRDLGVRLAIDDFGVGFSSLNYLKVLPVGKIKIDRSFISELEHSHQDAAITQGIISMAHHLQLRVTAEGVETEAQRQFLCANRCDELQGYLFAKPMSFTDMQAYLKRETEASSGIRPPAGADSDGASTR